jgi:hypothetical protein
MGTESVVRLESPWIGLPIVARLCLILWRVHFVEHDLRPVTLMMQIMTPLPLYSLDAIRSGQASVIDPNMRRPLSRCEANSFGVGKAIRWQTERIVETP